MEMLNRAVEDAAAFDDFKKKVMGRQAEMMRRMAQAAQHNGSALGVAFAGLDRQPGENRAEHRARLKQERRATKNVRSAR